MEKNRIRLCVFLFAFLATAHGAHASWQLSGDLVDSFYGGGIHNIISSGTNLFAGSDSGVFLSTNNGTSWTEVNAGLQFNNWTSAVYALLKSGSNLLAGSSNGIYLSSNNGTTWSMVHTGMPNDGYYIDVSALIASGTNLFAGTDSGVYISTDNGTSWAATGMGGFDNPSIISFLANGTSLFAGARVWSWSPKSGAYLSTNNGTSWTPLQNGLPLVTVRAFAMVGTNLVAATDSGVYLSANNGTSWTAANTSLLCKDIWALAASGKTLFASCDSGVIRSNNNGASWTVVNTGLPRRWVNALAVIGTDLYVGCGNNVWRRPLSELAAHPQNGLLPVNSRIRISSSHDRVMITYSGPSSCPVHFDLFTLSGKMIASFGQEKRGPGKYSLTFDTGRIPAGLYAYNFRAGSYRESNHCLISK